MKTLKYLWTILDRPIYVGERLEANLKALTYVSIATALLGVILIIINIVKKEWIMLTASILTFIAALGCAYFAGVRKNREAAGLIPTIFCAVMFTLYTVTGVGEGTAILWSLLIPIGISYFVSVKNGILMSIYNSLMFFAVFYTPLRAQVASYYSESFLIRFPLLFSTLSVFTAIAMIQYHRAALLEIDYTDQLNREVERQTRVARERADKLAAMSEEMVQTLAYTIDAKDRYTNGHSFRVSWYSTALAEALGWSEDEIRQLRREALLHDIGKIGVPDNVLNKPGRLTNEEYAVIKSHTTMGGDILADSETLIGASIVARYHHERYDGKGYPEGLAGEAIPLHARVVAVSDAYDAMHSDRIYRKGLSKDVIRAELIKGRGTQFDPVLLDVFLRLFESGALDELDRKEGHTALYRLSAVTGTQAVS